MGRKAHGQIRRSQIIMTWGPGALLDLPRHAVIVGGLEQWPNPGDLEEIFEPRLSRKLQLMTGIPTPRLYLPPIESDDPREKRKGIGVWQFPEWFVVQEEISGGDRERSRRLVHRNQLDERGRFEGRFVTPTRFVRACVKGHVDDIDWRSYVHGSHENCRRQLWLDETGTSGDLSDLEVRCECGRTPRSLIEARVDFKALGTCSGRRPWLGRAEGEECNKFSQLLIRTAANAYFPQVISVLAIPDRGNAVQDVVSELWDDLQIVETLEDLNFLKKKPRIAGRLVNFSDSETLEAIRQLKHGSASERPVKQVELDALLAVPEGYGDDVPIDPDFHARRLPDKAWRKSGLTDEIESVIQVHRLREVLALTGFTRFEAEVPDIQGEYETDVERADLAADPRWFPAIENRGEGVFVQLRTNAVRTWLERKDVGVRLDELKEGHKRWMTDRKVQRAFPGGPYILLHTLSHLLIQSLAMRCGYPASSIRERIYVDPDGERYGILLYTGSPDAEGTLGGLVQRARHIADHLRHALQNGALCSNDPICAQHSPAKSMEGRWLLGASCHGCTLIAETSCEMRNDYLDRALVVPVLGRRGAAFFGNSE